MPDKVMCKNMRLVDMGPTPYVVDKEALHQLENQGTILRQTADLRVLRRGGDRVLQQKWQAMDGTVEWRDVPEVEV